ncbi:glycosyltransferase [Deferribacter autotrophicus]|uniref:Glycosyltransferase n=1 Tax=Deferribacter autotrophicus TaxID=500465 RepID=A0A5A8F2K6_9BACT|nr:glycosyltransferase [Deferribacter autotrophicus]KAA0257637.1 glycosyltransferase [Deferribacter autotrophicus]
MNKKKKVLFITSRLPYPPIGGDKLKSFNLLKILAKYFDVYLITITNEILNDTIKKELEKYSVSLKVFTKPKYLFYLNTLKFLFNDLPLQVNYYYFGDVKNYINNMLYEVDFAISTLIRTSKYLDYFNKPKYLDMVDSIALNYQRSKDNVKSFFWKTIYKIEIDRLFNYEKMCIKNFNSTFLVNKYEAEYWSKFGNTTWIPNGVNEEIFEYNKLNDKYRNYVAFFGKMDYQPNIDAVLWFTENVVPHLNKEIKFIIVGANPSKHVLRLSKKYTNIEVTGFINDPYEILNSSIAVIAPMQTGGGIQNKILESMALGTINIVSTLAAKPIIGAKHNEHLIVCDDPKEMAYLINTILGKIMKKN